MSISVSQWDDRTSWNRFVASVPHAHFQQSWEWGELSPQLGGRPLRLGATRNGELIGAMQIFIQRLGPLARTGFYVPRGPAVLEPSVEVLGPLFDAARRAGQAHGAAGIKIEANVPGRHAAWETCLASLGLRATYPPTQPRSSWLLNIEPASDELLRGMKPKTRYNIKLATRKGVCVSPGDVSNLDEFYALLSETAERDAFYIQPKSVYRRMFELFQESGRFRMLLARFQGELIGAATLFRFGSTCWYMHGASGNSHRNLMAPYLLQWRAIEWARQEGCSLYDFRAVPDILREDQDMFGVYRFKEGFGGYQFTAMNTFAMPFVSGLFGLWQAFYAGRFALTARQRRRNGLPQRQFA